MEGINNRIIMRQIRKNLLDRFLAEAERGEGRFDEFVRFVALEPIEINEDVYERLSRLTNKTIGFARVPRIDIGPPIPAPILTERSIRGLKRYLKARVVSELSKIVRKLLIRLLIIEERPVSVMVTKLNQDFNRTTETN